MIFAIAVTWIVVALILLAVGDVLDIDWLFLAGVGLVNLFAAAAVLALLVGMWVEALS